jgi:hypothetical protein
VEVREPLRLISMIISSNVAAERRRGETAQHIGKSGLKSGRGRFAIRQDRCRKSLACRTK